MRCISLILVRQYLIQSPREKVVLQIVGVIEESRQCGMLWGRPAGQEQHQRLVLHFVSPGYLMAGDVDVPSFFRLNPLQLGDVVFALHVPPGSEIR